MTNLEALKGIVGHPMGNDSFNIALQNRGLSPSGQYDTGARRQMELAQADCLITVITSPSSISEGGYSVSKADAGTLMKLASSLYRKWGVSSPVGASLYDATNKW